MARCSAIKPNGERCRGIAKAGSDWCPAHDPARAEERKRAASKAARSKPSRELVEIKRELRIVIGGVLSGRIERSVGAVAFQGFNSLLKAVEVERRVKETEELEERIRQMEEMIA